MSLPRSPFPHKVEGIAKKAGKSEIDNPPRPPQLLEEASPVRTGQEAQKKKLPKVIFLCEGKVPAGMSMDCLPVAPLTREIQLSGQLPRPLDGPPLSEAGFPVKHAVPSAGRSCQIIAFQDHHMESKRSCFQDHVKVRAQFPWKGDWWIFWMGITQDLFLCWAQSRGICCSWIRSLLWWNLLTSVGWRFQKLGRAWWLQKSDQCCSGHHRS